MDSIKSRETAHKRYVVVDIKKNHPSIAEETKIGDSDESRKNSNSGINSHHAGLDDSDQEITNHVAGLDDSDTEAQAYVQGLDDSDTENNKYIPGLDDSDDENAHKATYIPGLDDSDEESTMHKHVPGLDDDSDEEVQLNHSMNESLSELDEDEAMEGILSSTEKSPPVRRHKFNLNLSRAMGLTFVDAPNPPIAAIVQQQPAPKTASSKRPLILNATSPLRSSKSNRILQKAKLSNRSVISQEPEAESLNDFSTPENTQLSSEINTKLKRYSLLFNTDENEDNSTLETNTQFRDSLPAIISIESEENIYPLSSEEEIQKLMNQSGIFSDHDSSFESTQVNNIIIEKSVNETHNASTDNLNHSKVDNSLIQPTSPIGSKNITDKSSYIIGYSSPTSASNLNRSVVNKSINTPISAEVKAEITRADESAIAVSSPASTNSLNHSVIDKSINTPISKLSTAENKIDAATGDLGAIATKSNHNISNSSPTHTNNLNEALTDLVTILEKFNSPEKSAGKQITPYVSPVLNNSTDSTVNALIEGKYEQQEKQGNDELVVKFHDETINSSPDNEIPLNPINIEPITVERLNESIIYKPNESFLKIQQAIIHSLETKIDKLNLERGPLFFLGYSTAKTEKKIAALKNAVNLLADQESEPQSLHRMNQVVASLSKKAPENKALHQSRLGLPFFSFGKSETERFIDDISVENYQQQLKQILEDEKAKITRQQSSFIGKHYYHGAKSAEKLAAVTKALENFNSQKNSDELQTLDGLNNFIVELLSDKTITQYRSIGFFGCHVKPSTTETALDALAKRVCRGIERLRMDEPAKYKFTSR